MTQARKLVVAKPLVLSDIISTAQATLTTGLIDGKCPCAKHATQWHREDIAAEYNINWLYLKMDMSITTVIIIMLPIQL